MTGIYVAPLNALLLAFGDEEDGSQCCDRSLRPSPCNFTFVHGEPIMAPPLGFDTEQIRDKARKDLLYLLSVVSKAPDTAPTAV
jgi:hypothetical protein